MTEILKVDNLHKSFGKHEVIKGISFSLNQGEICGFIGPNGADKSTTFKLLASLLIPDSGTIVINGFNLHSQREKALSNLSCSIEAPGLYTELSGYDNLSLIGKLRNCKKEDIIKAADFTGIGAALKRKVGSYSMGMKQRLILAMCILPKPKLLLLDEPTNGLDPTGVLEFRETLKQIVIQQNTTVLISSHILGELDKVCNRFLFIKDGKLVNDAYRSKDISYRYRLATNNNLLALSLLLQLPETELVSQVGNELEITFNTDEALTKALSLLVSEKLLIKNITAITNSSEEEYRSIFYG